MSGSGNIYYIMAIFYIGQQTSTVNSKEMWTWMHGRISQLHEFWVTHQPIRYIVCFHSEYQLWWVIFCWKKISIHNSYRQSGNNEYNWVLSSCKNVSCRLPNFTSQPAQNFYITRQPSTKGTHEYQTVNFMSKLLKGNWYKVFSQMYLWK